MNLRYFKDMRGSKDRGDATAQAFGLGRVLRPELLDEWARTDARIRRCVASLGAPLTYDLLQPRLDEREGARLQDQARVQSLTTRLLRRRGVELCVALERDGVPCVAIKGLANGTAFWPFPELRAISDVDLLFTPADLPRAVVWFRDHGFRAVLPDFQDPHERTFLRRLARKMLRGEGGCPVISPGRDYVVDVHEYAERNPVPRTMETEEILAASTLVPTPWGGLRVPSPTHTIIIAALHAHRSYYGASQAKTVLDGILVARRHPDEVAERVLAQAQHGAFRQRVLFFFDLARAFCREDPLPTVPAWRPGLLAGRLRDAATAQVTLREDRTPSERTKLHQYYALADTFGEYTLEHLTRLRSLTRPWSRIPPGLDTVSLRKL